MRFFVAVIALAGWALSLPASAQQAGDCRSITLPSERLACYDKQMPPNPPKKNAKQAPADPIAGEDEALKAKLRDICARC